jgi:superfamily I DNA and/or RNA helicase
MYSGQRNLIQDRLRRIGEQDAERIRVSTVDGFQGEENEIIILSLVRSNASSIGFLRTSNRVCVGLSRAKKVMVASSPRLVRSAHHPLSLEAF